MQLIGYVVESTSLSRLGTSDEGSVETHSERHFEELVALDARLGLPEGAAESVLRRWIVDGRGAGPGALSVLELLVGASRRDRLEDDAWSPVRSGALDDLDAALQKAGLPRNATLRKLARPACGASSRPLVLDDGLLFTLHGHDYVIAGTNAWPPAVGRLVDGDLLRARALLGWWEKTQAQRLRASLAGRQVACDLLLALS
jgi:hypothetical protein